MDYFNNNKLEAISLMTSCGCNLNCSYCIIQGTTNEYSSQLQNNTKQALEDGTFLNNVKKIYKKFHCNTSETKQIDLWGQEPTLTLDSFTKNLKDWLNAFPSLERLFFSTNGMDYTYKIIDLIKALEENLTTTNFQLEIQISYDGNYSTNNIRKAKAEKILSNAKYLITEINKIKLKKIRINLVLHGVISNALVYELDSYQKVKDYYVNLFSDVDELQDLIINKNFSMLDFITLGYEVPMRLSTEDAYKWTTLYRRIRSVQREPEFANRPMGAFLSLNGHAIECLHDILERYQCNNINDLLKFFSKAPKAELININNELSKRMSCGNNYSELKIMYDGTLANCQNHLFETKLEYIKPDSSLEGQVRQELARHHYFINPLIDDKETIRKNLHFFKTMKEDSFFYTYIQTVILMFYMAQAGQIDESYLDISNILKDAFILVPTNQCGYNNQIATGSIFNKDTGTIRKFCNGMINNVKHQEINNLWQ